MPSKRVARECYFCREKQDRGEEVKLTHYVKLTQHLRTAHGLTADEAKAASSRKRSGATKRTQSGKPYFECTLGGCGKHVANKGGHLSQVHKMASGTEDYREALRTAYRRVKRQVKPVKVSQPDAVPGGSQPAAVPGGSRSAFYDSDLEVDQDQDAGTPEVAKAARTKGEDLRYMGPADVHFRKHQRLVPAGCKPFDVVQRWHDFRMLRAGGNKKKGQHVEDMGYANRFLAHCNFQNERWYSVTREMVTAHDAALVKAGFEPGTVARILTAILDFWQWVRKEGYIRRAVFDKVQQYLDGCLKSTRKDVLVRNAERRVDDDEDLPDATLYIQFEQSDYVKQLRAAFRAKPMMFLYEMTCALIVLIGKYNGPRPSMVAGMRIKDLDTAELDLKILAETGERLWSIAVPKHKTAASGKNALIVVDQTLMDELRHYRRAVSELVKFLDVTATLIRKRDFSPATAEDITRMARAGWLACGLTNITKTQIRKLTTKVGRQKDPKMSGMIARKLGHRETTADTYYAVNDDRQAAVQTYVHIREAFQEAVEKVHQRSAAMSTLSSGQVSLSSPAAPAAATASADASPVDMEVEPSSDIVPDSPQASTSGTAEYTATMLPQPSSSSMPDFTDTVVPSTSSTPDVPATQWVQLKKPGKPKSKVSSAIRAEIEAVYSNIIDLYSLDVNKRYRSVPISNVRDLREDRWPDLSDKQLVDMVRNMVKARIRELAE